MIFAKKCMFFPFDGIAQSVKHICIEVIRRNIGEYRSFNQVRKDIDAMRFLIEFLKSLEVFKLSLQDLQRKNRSPIINEELLTSSAVRT